MRRLDHRSRTGGGRRRRRSRRRWNTGAGREGRALAHREIFARRHPASAAERSRRDSFEVTPRDPSTPLRYAQDDGDEISLRAAEEPFSRMPTGVGKMPALPARNANGAIRIHGAREHNLKNIDVAIPRDQMVVITGLSGSGKSTLAFDILFAEGQRRFLDSMSPYARQFVEQLEKPDVDLVEGVAAERRDRATRHARRRQIDRRHRDGSLSFSPAALRQNRHAILSRLRSAGRKTKRRRDRETGGDGGATRPAQGARAARQSAQRISHRCRALGGAAGVRHAFRRWPARSGRAISKTRAIQGAHHRRRGRRDRREAHL